MEFRLLINVDGSRIVGFGIDENGSQGTVLALKVNQICPPVESEQGFHIVKMLEHKPARKKPYAEVRNDIREYLQTEAYGKALPVYFKQLKKESSVRVLLAD